MSVYDYLSSIPQEKINDNSRVDSIANEYEALFGTKQNIVRQDKKSIAPSDKFAQQIIEGQQSGGIQPTQK